MRKHRILDISKEKLEAMYKVHSILTLTWLFHTSPKIVRAKMDEYNIPVKDKKRKWKI